MRAVSAVSIEQDVVSCRVHVAQWLVFFVAVFLLMPCFVAAVQFGALAGDCFFEGGAS
jgi:hypothetical protein